MNGLQLDVKGFKKVERKIFIGWMYSALLTKVIKDVLLQKNITVSLKAFSRWDTHNIWVNDTENGAKLDTNVWKNKD